jgi:putative aminopeptidase FrvX
VRDLIRSELGALAERSRVDAMGNLIVDAGGPDGAPVVMISAHMDEIGFVVSHVDDEGFLRLQNLGGFDARNLFARLVTVHTRHGTPRVGVLNPGVKPVHIASAEDRKAKIPELSDFVVDLGLPPRPCGRGARRRHGHAAPALRRPRRRGGGQGARRPQRLLGAARDAQAADAPAVRVVGVFSVQEEVGLRGAITSAFALEPDVGVALDTTLAVDTPGTKDHLAVTRLGHGVGIKVSDSSSMVSHGWLVDAMAVARRGERHRPPVRGAARGGTDGGAIQRSRGGVATITLSNPSRYVHTVTEMLAKRDLEAAVALLGAFLRDARRGAATKPLTDLAGPAVARHLLFTRASPRRPQAPRGGPLRPRLARLRRPRARDAGVRRAAVCALADLDPGQQTDPAAHRRGPTRGRRRDARAARRRLRRTGLRRGRARLPREACRRCSSEGAAMDEALTRARSNARSSTTARSSARSSWRASWGCR